MGDLKILAMTSVLAIAGFSTFYHINNYHAMAAVDDTASIIKKRLPKTQISHVDCEQIEGLCAVQAGDNIFYTDNSGRYLIVGRVFDMETKQDLTSAALLQNNPSALIGNGQGQKSNDNVQEAADTPEPKHLDNKALNALPNNGAIKWGKGKESVTVFSDLRCGYCQKLHNELQSANIKVVERPISILGTRPFSEAVICDKNPAKALKKAYQGQDLHNNDSQCDTSGLDANEQFARANGLTGTPVIVREDGAMLMGYRPAAFIKKWVREAQ